MSGSNVDIGATAGEYNITSSAGAAGYISNFPAVGDVTLNLTNVDINTANIAIDASAMITGTLTINLIGANTITSTANEAIKTGGANVVINGSGSLTLAGTPNVVDAGTGSITLGSYMVAYGGASYNVATTVSGGKFYSAADGTTSITKLSIYMHKSGTSVPYYNIKITQEGRGLVDPDGGDDDKISVRQGNDKTFEFQPLHYAKIYNIIVDGEELGPMDSYTFEDVRETHTIHVMFCAETDPDWVNPLDTNGDGIPDAEQDLNDLNGNGIPDDEEPLEATLNRDDHNAYAQGYEDGTFRPEDYISRAETITEFFESLVLEYDEDTEYLETFSDATGEEWYANTLGFMQQAAVVEGYSDNTFRGDNFITRAEFAVIASRFDDLETEGENTFSDVDDDYWAIDYINSAAAKGWILGYTDGTFRPDQYITRAEAVTLINRVLNRSADMDFAAEHSDELVEFSDVVEEHWAADQIVEATNSHSYTIQDGVEIWTGIL